MTALPGRGRGEGPSWMRTDGRTGGRAGGGGIPSPLEASIHDQHDRYPPGICLLGSFI